MAVNYNTLKSLKGTSIGTIVPWCGEITAIPAGWRRCDGSDLNTGEYSDLFDIIGYRYGGSGNTFKLPKFDDKCVVDYHTSHTNIISGGISTTFRNQINNLNDVANSIELNPISSIDLYVEVNADNTYIGQLEGVGLNAPAYFDSLIVASRLMGDYHLSTHSHNSFVTVVGRPNAFVEACQNNSDANCFSVFGVPDCSDDCDDYEVWRNETNNADTSRTQIYTSESINVMESLYTKPNSNNGIGRIPATADFARVTTPSYNYLSPSFDTLESSGNTYPYPVTLATNLINFVSGSSTVTSASDPHRHNEMSFSIDIGNVAFQDLYTINNIGTGNVNPINNITEEIATFRANVSTASLQILHIIRAF